MGVEHSFPQNYKHFSLVNVGGHVLRDYSYSSFLLLRDIHARDYGKFVIYIKYLFIVS